MNSDVVWNALARSHSVCARCRQTEGRRMRKIFVVLVTVVTAISLAGCIAGGKGKSPFGKGKAPVVTTRG